jgi:hypothetical protein
MSASSFIEANAMSASADFTKFGATKLSASTKEFVPSSLSASTKEFVPSFLMTSDVNASSYAMNGEYQYDPYMMQNQANPYPQYDTTQASMAPAQNCALLSLDDYSDFSSDDEPQQLETKVTLPTAEPMVEHPTRPLCSERSETPTTPMGSTCAPESDICSIESDMSDTDHDRTHNANLPCFSIVNLLKMRHAVPWLDGAEEGMTAEKVTPGNEHGPEKGATGEESNAHNEHKAKQAPTALSRLQSCIGNRPVARHSSGRKTNPDKKTRAENKRKDLDKGSDKGSGLEELQASNISWASQAAHRRKIQKGDGVESPSTEEVVRTMKSILNKLTLEKFEPLYAKLVSCGIQTTGQLEVLIHEVFEKATSQHHFIPMYADLCVRLHTHFTQSPVTDGPKMTFKKILLNGCQAFFEKHLKPPANLDDLDEEERLALTYKYKMQMIGNIKFVGALLVRQMLAAKVLFAISEELLGAPTPESLESLAALLTVVGPKFDMVAWPAHQMLVDIFDRVKALTETPKLNCRVRCLLKDLLELRASRWHDRKPKKIEAPSTLKEVADTQAAEQKAGGSSCKAPAKKAAPGSPAKTWPGQATKTWPGHGQGAKEERTGGRQASSVASDLFARGAKAAAPKESYQRINSLAGLKAGAKSFQALDQKETKSERPRKQPKEEQSFDKEACRKEISGALAELRLSLEVKEALERISGLSVPSSMQAEELCDMLAHMVEEGSTKVRKACFELVARLFREGHWKSHALGRSLQDFLQEVCPDLKCDIPMLPTILREELCPALAPLVSTGALTQPQHDALAAC